MVSAKGAALKMSLGTAPGNSGNAKPASAEGAIHSGLERRYSE
jgi:hypothetical protein